jgi:hypothetical protein
MMNDLIPVNDIEKMAIAIAKSNLFGFKKPEEAMALMLIAQAEGMHPALAARDYNIILGRPALKADAMLARFQNAGGKVEWKDYTDQKVAGVFSHPSGGSVLIEWTMKRAIDCGLGTKDNWKKWPRQMLRARVISEGIRTVYPGVSVGIYTPEEVQDFDDRPKPIAHPEPTIEDGHIDPLPVPNLNNGTVVSTPLLPNASTDQQVTMPLANTISDAQARRLFAIWKASGKSEEERKSIMECFGFSSSKDITRDKYEEICKAFEGKPSRQPGEE